jgi:HK97 family phage portal protein
VGQLANAVKATFRLGGTGGTWLTPRANDIVYVDPWSVDASRVAGVNVTAEKAMSYIPFFAAVRNISEDVAGLPLGVFRATAEGRQQDRSHPLHRVLHDAPNPYMTSFTFRETLQAHMLTWGNGYAEIEYGEDGSVLGLWPLRPDRMEVLVDAKANAPVYRYTTAGRTVDLPWRKVLHLHGLGFDGLVGYSILSIARGMLGIALAGEKHSQTDFARGTVPPAILKTQGKLSIEAKQNLRESWDSLDHRDRVAILEEGLDLQVIGVPAKDSEFIATMNMPRSLMATLLRIPPHMLQDVDRSTSWGSGIEQQTLGYSKFTLRPWLIRWEQAGKQQLSLEDDRYLRHNMTAFERGDTATRWNAYEAGLRNGIYSVDDIRELEDLNPLPDGLGDVRFAPLNMAPLDQFKQASMRERIEMLGALVRAGFDPAAASDAIGVPEIEHTGLEPVTVSEQG